MKPSVLVRHVVLLLLTGLLPVPGPAPTPVSAQEVERTIFDAIVIAIPPAASAPCVLVEQGRLTARAALTGHPAPQPVTLQVTASQGSGLEVGASLPVGREEVSTTLPVVDGPLCWTVTVAPPIDLSTASPAERSAYVQYVALRLTLAPE